MSFVNKLNPSSAAFVPDTSNQLEAMEYMGVFGTEFSAGFPDLAMDMNIEPAASETCPQKQEYILSENATGQQQQDSSSAFAVPAITLEKVQIDMYNAFSSFMQLQNDYKTKLQHVERELAKNVQEAHNLRQDVDVLSSWAKAVLEYFGNEEASKHTVSPTQKPVV